MQNRENTIKFIAKQLSGLSVKEENVEIVVKKLNLDPEKPQLWSSNILIEFAKEIRRITKPIVIAANKIDIPGSENNYKKLKDQFPHLSIIPCSAEAEIALRKAEKSKAIKYIPGEDYFEIIKDINDKQKQALNFIKDNILKKYNGTGIQQILDNVIFNVLKYIAVFPGGLNKLADQYGNVLPDCFLMKQGSTALDFAFKIHTDIGNNFIKAIDVKTRKVIGKEHILNHRDVIEIITRK